MDKRSEVTRQRSPLTLPNLLLCEGPDDVAFFQKLISLNRLPHFCVRDTATERGGPGGNTKFGLALKALSLNFRKVRRILVVADNDDDPASSFENVLNQLAAVFPKNKLPDSPLKRTSVTDRIDVTVMMTPRPGEPGNLETLCEEAARRANTRFADLVDRFSRDSDPPAWASETRKKEMWLRCNLAVRCREDPFIFLGTAFRQYNDLIPLNDRCFSPIISVLKTFDS